MISDNSKIKLKNYDDSQVIWRYMDFTKFLSMLQYESLFFCTCAKMQELDPFEGDYPKKNLEKLRENKDKIKLLEKYYKKPAEYRKKFLENVGINCWHANNSENAAMWRVYLSSQEGLAIKTTISNLKNAFNENKEDVIYIGDIEYNDYEFNSVDMNYDEYIKNVNELADRENNAKKKVTDSDILNKLSGYYYSLIMSKRKEFDYEKEIRLITPFNQKTKKERVKNFGKLVKANLDILIDKIIISPSSADWFIDLVKCTMEQYQLSNKKVIKSKIYEKFQN